MNSKIWVLTKLFLKNGQSSFSKKKKNNKNNKKSYSGSFYMIALFVVLTLTVALPIFGVTGEMFHAAAKFNQQGIILGLAIVSTCLIVFIFGIFYVLNTFYFSADIESVLHLPVKPYEILCAKFFTTLVYQYFTLLIFLAPILISYGVNSSASIVYYLTVILIFLLLPIIPLILASAIDMVIMRFTNLGKHKDALKVVGGLFGITFGVGINIVFQNLGKGAGSGVTDTKALLDSSDALLNKITALFPPASISSKAAIEFGTISGLSHLFLFLLLNAAFFILFIMLAQGLYFKGVIGSSETFSKRKKLSSKELDENLKQNSKVKSLTIKELRLIFRTPAYLMNCVISNFIWPVFMLIPIFTQPNLGKSLSNVSTILANEKTYSLVIAITFAVSIFLGASNAVTTTAISREGQNLFICKYVPASYKDQLIAKVLSGVILSLSGYAVMLILAFVFLQPGLVLGICMIIVSIIGIIFSSMAGIFIDLKRPKLNWDNEQKAVKQNMNVLFSTLLSMVVAGGSIYILVKLNFNYLYSFSLIVAVFGLVDLFLYNLLCTWGQKLFAKINA